MDDLFSLIRKMSQTEKRLFAIFSKSGSQNFDGSEVPDIPASSRSKASKKYLQLFQAYQKLAGKHDSPPPEEEQKIRRSLGESDSQFATLKKYLSEQLLDFLRHHHRQNLPELRLHNLLLDARILEEKGEIGWAQRKLKKAFAEALEFEIFHVAFEALKRTIRILLRNQTPSFEELNDLMAHMEDLLRKQTVELEYRREELRTGLISKSKFKLARTPEQKVELDNLEQDLQRRNVATPPLTFQSQYSYYVSLFSLDLLRGDFRKSYKSVHAVIEVWDRFPKMRAFEPILYMTQLGNLLISCIRLHLLDEAAEVIKKMEEIPPKNKETELARISNFETRVFVYLINCNRLEEAIRYGKDLEKKIDKYESLLPAYHKRNLQFNFAVLYFLTSDYKTAHEILNSLLQREYKNMPKLSIVAIEMIILLLRYEMKDHDFVRTSYHTISKRMRTLNLENVFERKTVNALFKLVNTPDERSRRLLLRGFWHYLGEVRNSENFTKPTGFEEIEIWAEARSEGISMREVFARSLRRQAEQIAA